MRFAFPSYQRTSKTPPQRLFRAAGAERQGGADRAYSIGGQIEKCQFVSMIETMMLFRIGDAAQDDGDFDLARRSFEQGASLGCTICLTRLALIYDIGLGMAPDKKVAMRLYHRAWRRDRCLTAANNIAILYREKGNHRAMFQWFRRGAHAADEHAQFEVAKCYLNGIGVRADAQTGLRLLAAAIQSPYMTDDEHEEATALMSRHALRLV